MDRVRLLRESMGTISMFVIVFEQSLKCTSVRGKLNRASFRKGRRYIV